ncbi:prepronociceptin [Betta splendens]|uniref:Prepronociceptin n=1 Tax=Betta splendens TaxID=158456 RepID=A0A6P7M4R6_BETSP|nr:prepronociceptin [Betta splendens]XP_029001237.1 prepronociceptin [Betta splendens]
MKTVVALLLLCLCDPGWTDCQADCVSCSNILPTHLSFKPLVCLIECEANAAPASSWDSCRRALLLPLSSLSGALQRRSQEEVEALFPEEETQVEGGLLLPVDLPRFVHANQALGMDQRGVTGNQLNAAYKSEDAISLEDEYEEEEAEQGDGHSDSAAGPQADLGLSISKRFGGFVKGRHGYRKLLSPVRAFQKRYGGFTGIRKSARKWNNQKRFSEFLKQYLGMSTRAAELDGVAGDLSQV